MENAPARPQSSRDRLKKKLKDKKAQRTGEVPKTGIPQLDNDPDIFNMISQVQSILKNNPEMVAKVSSCVNSLMSNPEIMEKLNSQISNDIQVSSQTLGSSSSGESPDAVSK